MLHLRLPQTIAHELLQVTDVPHLRPDHRFSSVEIAGDLVFLDSRTAKNETEGRDAPLVGLGTAWWVFAVSGTGDAWLISADDNAQRIAFLDHDAGPEATPQLLGIDFTQWLQLADVVRQFEWADALGLSAQAEQLLEQISAGLSGRYPYQLLV